MANRILPKSLHTVRVLTIMGRMILANNRTDENLDSYMAVERAAMLLGYSGTPDEYALKAKAVDAIDKGK